MDMEEASLSPRNVAKGGWIVVFVSLLALAGGTYIFGIYSEAIKEVLGYDQETLTTLGFFKDLGGNVGIVSGLINEVTLPWVVLGIIAIMSVTQMIARPKTWQMYLYTFLGANYQTFANTGALVACVKKFCQRRGGVLGILKGFVGFSGAIISQTYQTIYGKNNTWLILLMGILPAAVSLAVMLIVRPTKVVAHRKQIKHYYSFLYKALPLAGFLMIMIVVENRMKHFPQSGYQIVAALAIVFLMFNIVVVVNAEMHNMKLQRLTSQSRNGSQKPVPIDVREDVEIKNDEKPKTEISLTNSISEAHVNQQKGKNSEQPISLRPCLMKMFKSPTRREDYSIPQTLVSVDMARNEKPLGYIPVSISTFVSHMSIWNFLGCGVVGFLSEFPLQRYKFPRSLMFTIILLIACVGHVFIPFALPGSLYVASVVIGLSFRAQRTKSLRSPLLNGFHFINGKGRERENKVLKYLSYCEYMGLKKASLLTRNVTKGRWFVVFICFLIMSTAEGAFMRSIYSETQSAQTISDTDSNQYVPVVHLGHGASETVVHTPVGVFNVEKYGAGGDGKHSTQRTVTTMERVIKGRRLLEQGKSKPPNPKIDVGQPAQHN